MNNSRPKWAHSSAAFVNGAPTDSGLTCLLVIARFHDLPADESQLRHQFAQSGQVLSDAELLRAAKHLGLKAGLLKTAWSKLQGTPLPAMAKQADGRYVVLAKVEEEKVLVQDPVEARSLVFSREQFEATWTGELLLFTKRAAIRPQELTFDFTWFIPAIVKYRKLFGEVLIASFFLQLFALLTPLFTQVVIDKVLVHKGVHDAPCVGDRYDCADHLRSDCRRAPNLPVFPYDESNRCRSWRTALPAYPGASHLLF